MKVTFRDICWAAVVTLIILFLSKCHRDEKGQLNEKVKEIDAKFKNDSITHNAERLLLEGKLSDQQAVTAEVTKKNDIVLAKLNVSEATINRLAAAIRTAKLLPIDTSFVTVSPEYVTYCDSLANESEFLTADLIKYKNLNTGIIISKDRELSIKDSMIMTEKLAVEKCRKNYSDLQFIYGLLNKSANQVYIGAELLGNQYTIFQNVGVALSLKTKSNKLWQVSGGLQNGGRWYGRINGNILISFK